MIEIENYGSSNPWNAEIQRINIEQISITGFHRRGSPQQTFVHPYKSLVAHAFATIISEIPRTVRAPCREIDLRDRERNEEHEVQLINPLFVRHLLYGRLCDGGFK